MTLATALADVVEDLDVGIDLALLVFLLPAGLDLLPQPVAQHVDVAVHREDARHVAAAAAAAAAATAGAGGLLLLDLPLGPGLNQNNQQPMFRLPTFNQASIGRPDRFSARRSLLIGRQSVFGQSRATHVH